MADMIVTEKSNITAIANAVRNKTGTTGAMTLGQMATNINNISGGGEDLTAEITAQDNLISKITTALQGKAAGGGSSGGGSMKTCTVTVVQTWGQENDPSLLALFIPYYNISADGSVTSGYTTFDPGEDLEPYHSITFTAAKNAPITVVARAGYTHGISWTTAVNGGTMELVGIPVENQWYLYHLIPTSDTATFTFVME